MSGGPGPEPPELVAVGRVLRAHGIHGAVLVAPLSDVSERFDAGSRLLLGPDGDRVLRVLDRRGQPIKPLLRFEGIVDRTSAEALAGTYLFVPASESPELPEDEFWPYQLIGLPVVTASGRDLGTIREVLRTPANDIWVARDSDGTETLVPALKDVVLEVDRLNGRISVADVPGLTAPETPS